MFKPFKERVQSTYDFILTLANYSNNNAAEIINIHNKANMETAQQNIFDISWKLDTTKFELIDFKGFKAEFIKSKLTNQERLFYNRNKPYTKKIRYYNHYTASNKVSKPEYYLIPQAWNKAIARLKANGIIMKQLQNDSSLSVSIYYIIDGETVKEPFENHYIHSNTKIYKTTDTLQFYKGDYLIKTNQTKNRYIVEMLEPLGVDSYFSWNMFDAILMQKEWFSPYIFEEKAIEILANNTKLKKQFEEKKKSNPEFAANHIGQLYFIYKNSPYFEKTFKRYPVVRIEK